MIIVDAHQDIAYNAYCFRRDYTLPVFKKREIEPYTDPRTGPGRPTISLPDSLIGRVALVFATLFVSPKESPFLDRWSEPLYRDAREAHDLALLQMEYYERLAGENRQIQLVKNQADLNTVLETWDPDVPLQDRVQGLIILMEGADPIVEPKQFEEWYELGVRVVGPAWSKTRYSAGTGYPGPLTPLGFELLDVLAETNTLLDLSHLAEKAFYQAIERYEGPVIASHSNPRHFRDSDRQLSDDMLRLLAERDGVSGVVIYNRFLHPTWKPGEKRTDVPFSTVLDVIDHVCQLTGSARHVGIGSDMDGGFGLESTPYGIDTIGDLWWVGHGLQKRGYSEEDIEMILGGNFLRKVRETLPNS